MKVKKVKQKFLKIVKKYKKQIKKIKLGWSLSRHINDHQKKWRFYMQQYPTISKSIIKDLDYYIFDKLDGSNIRVEFSLKNGFDKFGTRKKLMSDDSGILNISKDLILKYESITEEIFKKNKWKDGTLFFEFHGENSFAGFHDEKDDFKVSLIDAHIVNLGYLAPKEYLKTFEGKIEMSEFIKIGKLNKTTIHDIENGLIPGVTFEGVIGKALVKNKIVRCKVKSKLWLSKLKDRYGNDDELYKKLE